ncbi:hypothetical protein TNCT_511701 [Trichonephila clavata]|uniref:Uncharacterized protein n=1 Tax=Trichonephila clavata TaxID=2740835 RepID=A0A8X6F8C5_TRICU|nr:hypothetical protein TNCT_511701 [Trichonephila clavata]
MEKEEDRKKAEDRYLERKYELELARIEAARWKAEKEARIREAKHKEEKEAKLRERGGSKAHNSSKVLLNSADDKMYEEKEETPVDVIKDKAKDDINPLILSTETLDLENDVIKEEKSKLPKRTQKN